MKKIVSIIMSVMIITTLAGCGSGKSAESTTEEEVPMAHFDLKDIGFDVPESWTYSDATKNHLFFYPDGYTGEGPVDAYIDVFYIDTEYGLHLTEQEYTDLASQCIDGINENKNTNIEMYGDSCLTNYPCKEIGGTLIVDGSRFNENGYLIMYNDDTYIAVLLQKESATTDYSDSLVDIVQGMSFNNEKDPPLSNKMIKDFIKSIFYDKYDALCYYIGNIYPEEYGSEGEWGPKVTVNDGVVYIDIRSIACNIPDVVDFSNNVIARCIHECGAHRVKLNVSEYSQSNESGIDDNTMQTWIGMDGSNTGMFFDNQNGYDSSSITTDELRDYFSNLRY